MGSLAVSPEMDVLTQDRADLSLQGWAPAQLFQEEINPWL